jgi:aminocarboxymuconate-semialdehyde decarboxylase
VIETMDEKTRLTRLQAAANHEDCDREHRVSRRQVLRAGFATLTAGALSGAFGALAQSQDRSKEIHGIRPIDIHAHYFPQAFLNLIGEEGKRFKAAYRTTDQGFFIDTPVWSGGPISTRMIDLKQRIADMNQQGVAIQAISLTAPMVNWGDAEFSHKLARTWNDEASAAHQAYPSRLVGLLTLPMVYPDHAVDELNRAGKLPGMRGVYMATNINSQDLGDPMFEPIWARIEDLDLPVFLHPVETVGGERLHPFHFSNLLGTPFDTAIAACHLIFGGVLDRHPKLRICLSHGGGALPIVIGRVDHGWQVHPEIRHTAQPPSAYLQRFTYDTIVHSKSILEFVIKEVGAERVMIGSDYCYSMGYDRPIEVLEKIDLTGGQRKMILGGTAAKLLKL